MRKTMNISVNEDIYEYIRERAEGYYFGSVSEYIRWLVRNDMGGKIQTEVKENARTRLRTANETIFLGLFEEFLDHYYGDSERG
jgi:Arc/MetJ-type ribon-helix-helix transcriptional regulator